MRLNCLHVIVILSFFYELISTLLLQIRSKLRIAKLLDDEILNRYKFIELKATVVIRYTLLFETDRMHLFR